MVAPPTDRVGSPDDAGLGEPTDVSAVHQLEAMPTAYFSLDTDWCFSYINAAGEKLLGSTRTELLGGNVWTCSRTPWVPTSRPTTAAR